MIWAFVVIWLASSSQSVQTGCRAEEGEALVSAAQMVARGDDTVAGEILERAGHGQPARCPLIDLARASLASWAEARALAASGGAVETLAPIQRALERFDLWSSSPFALEAEYAQVAVRAAIAAAQDERPEMELLLTHAGDLSERLAARGRRAVWPRTVNVLAGELWLEVDRYDEARLAYDRAIRGEQSPVALAGLGDTFRKLDREAEACAVYRLATGAAGPLAERLRALVAACP